MHETDDKKSFDNSGAESINEKQGGEATKSLPYWLILNAEGQAMATSQYKPGRNSGCPATVEEVEYFISNLKKTSALTDNELSIIAKRFGMNE